MISIDKMLDICQVRPGKKIRIKDFASDWDGSDQTPRDERRKFAELLLTEDQEALASQQNLLYAADTWSVLVIFQAMDAAGKDSTIKHVMSGVNPQGCQVFSFKHPSAEEVDHNFLWRCMKALPERGRIGIFNRSYYEEILIVKVHSEILERQRIPDVKVNRSFWEGRYEDINSFERHLSRNGTKIVKFFLNISKEEQRKRFLARIDDPHKQWKFSAADVAVRQHWDDYMNAYEQMFENTSTKWAPWYIIPADHKWVARSLVARILAWSIESLSLSYPQITDEHRRELEEARVQLEAEVQGKKAKAKSK